MFHDRRQRDRERLRKLADRHAVLFGKTRENRAPGRVRQSREGRIQFVVSIVNHVVKYMHAIGSVKANVFSSGRGSGRLR